VVLGLVPTDSSSVFFVAVSAPISEYNKPDDHQDGEGKTPDEDGKGQVLNDRNCQLLDANVDASNADNASDGRATPGVDVP
jgi:hypothetical protein